MKILVIGQSVVDRIFYKGIEEVKPGGIFYAVVALSNFTEQSDEIFLCSTISKKDENLFLEHRPENKRRPRGAPLSPARH